MRRDTIFYKLFSQFPGLLFELMDDPPANPVDYQFESVEIKETAFRIDGVFLPPDTAAAKIVCFAEVQFQKDEDLYDRFFAEISYFLRRAAGRYPDWRGVIILGSRRVEPSNTYLHRSMLMGTQVQRIYLDELDDQTSLGGQLMQLTLASEPAAIEQAKQLIAQAPDQANPALSERAIIDLITTILVYKLATCSREEIEAMLGLNLEEPRAIREARQEGREECGRSLILRLLTRRLGQLPDRLTRTIQALSVPQLEALGEALLDFGTLSDLAAWLESSPSTPEHD